MVMSCEPSRMPMRMRWMRKVLCVKCLMKSHVDRMSLKTSMRKVVSSSIRQSSRKYGQPYFSVLAVLTVLTVLAVLAVLPTDASFMMDETPSMIDETPLLLEALSMKKRRENHLAYL